VTNSSYARSPGAVGPLACMPGFDEEAPCASGLAHGLRQALMHEARTALVPVLGCAQILRSERFEPHVRDLAGYIVAGSEHLLLLVDDLVTLSDVEEESDTASHRRSTADPLLAEAGSTVMSAARLTGVMVRYGAISDQAFLADPLLAVRALRILLWIAIQCTQREKAVTVSVGRTDQGVAFRVTSGTEFTGPVALASDPWWNARQISPLGIRLVTAVARRHRGSLVLQNPVLASFDATLTFPCAD